MKKESYLSALRFPHASLARNQQEPQKGIWDNCRRIFLPIYILIYLRILSSLASLTTTLNFSDLIKIFLETFHHEFHSQIFG